MSVYKQYRICRRHFESSCMNGACRRLLNTAVPTLHLNRNKKMLRAPNKDVPRDLKLVEVIVKEDSQINYDLDFSNDINQIDVLDEYLLESNESTQAYNAGSAEKDFGMFSCKTVNESCALLII